MIALDVDGALAIATLSRAPVNAIDERWLERLDEVLSTVQSAPAVSVLLLAISVGLLFALNLFARWRSRHERA